MDSNLSANCCSVSPDALSLSSSDPSSPSATNGHTADEKELAASTDPYTHKAESTDNKDIVKIHQENTSDLSVESKTVDETNVDQPATSYKTSTETPDTSEPRTCKVNFCGSRKPPILLPCESCPKIFTTPSSLKKHMISHSDIRPFPCHVCGRRFKRVDHLINHKAALHKIYKYTYTCSKPGCKAEFRSQESCEKHVRIWHWDDATCDDKDTTSEVGTSTTVTEKFSIKEQEFRVQEDMAAVCPADGNFPMIGQEQPLQADTRSILGKGIAKDAAVETATKASTEDFASTVAGGRADHQPSRQFMQAVSVLIKEIQRASSEKPNSTKAEGGDESVRDKCSLPYDLPSGRPVLFEVKYPSAVSTGHNQSVLTASTVPHVREAVMMATTVTAPGDDIACSAAGEEHKHSSNIKILIPVKSSLVDTPSKATNLKVVKQQALVPLFIQVPSAHQSNGSGDSVDTGVKPSGLTTKNTACLPTATSAIQPEVLAIQSQGTDFKQRSQTTNDGGLLPDQPLSIWSNKTDSGTQGDNILHPIPTHYKPAVITDHYKISPTGFIKEGFEPASLRTVKNLTTVHKNIGRLGEAMIPKDTLINSLVSKTAINYPKAETGSKGGSSPNRGRRPCKLTGKKASVGRQNAIVLPGDDNSSIAAERTTTKREITGQQTQNDGTQSMDRYREKDGNLVCPECDKIFKTVRARCGHFRIHSLERQRNYKKFKDSPKKFPNRYLKVKGSCESEKSDEEDAMTEKQEINKISQKHHLYGESTTESSELFSEIKLKDTGQNNDKSVKLGSRDIDPGEGPSRVRQSARLRDYIYLPWWATDKPRRTKYYNLVQLKERAANIPGMVTSEQKEEERLHPPYEGQLLWRPMKNEMDNDSSRTDVIWTEDDILRFKYALLEFGKHFSFITQFMKTKSLAECVKFYYCLKKIDPDFYWEVKLNNDFWLSLSDQEQKAKQERWNRLGDEYFEEIKIELQKDPENVFVRMMEKLRSEAKGADKRKPQEMRAKIDEERRDITESHNFVAIAGVSDFEPDEQLSSARKRKRSAKEDQRMFRKKLKASSKQNKRKSRGSAEYSKRSSGFRESVVTRKRKLSAKAHGRRPMKKCKTCHCDIDKSEKAHRIKSTTAHKKGVSKRDGDTGREFRHGWRKKTKNESSGRQTRKT